MKITEIWNDTMNGDKSRNKRLHNKNKIFIMTILAFIGVIFLINSCSGNNTSSKSSSGSVRCSYCEKMIYSNGKAIHCTHKYLNTYKCDYCGHSNVIK